MLQPGESGHTLSPLSAFSPSRFLLAAIAVLCGAVAGGVLLHDGWQLVVMALVLAGAWQVVWSLLARTNWRSARAAWRAWSRSLPGRRLPYTQAGSDADKVSDDLDQFGAWLREWLWPHHGMQLGVALAAGMVMLALMIALGAPAMLLSVGMLIVMQIALALCGGNGWPAVWAEGLIVIGLPFALGLLVLTPAASWWLALACLMLGPALMAMMIGDTVPLHAGSALVMVTFVLLREPVAAAVMGIAWATAALLKPAGNRLALVVLCLLAVAAAIAL